MRYVHYPVAYPVFGWRNDRSVSGNGNIRENILFRDGDAELHKGGDDVQQAQKDPPPDRLGVLRSENTK